MGPDRDNVSSTPQADPANALFSEAQAFEQAGRLDDAERLYRAIPATASCHPDARHRLGLIAYQRGRAAEGAEHLTVAVAARPDDPTKLYHLGVMLRAAGRPEKALAALERAVGLSPDTVDVWIALASTRADTGQSAAALDACRRALGLECKSASALGSLGAALMVLGQLDAAADTLSKALALDPNLSEAQLNLGIVRYRLGKPGDAEVCFRRAIELRPKDAVAVDALATALRAQNRIDEALAAYRQAIELAPGFAEAHNNLGSLLRITADISGAIACFRRALALKPDYSVAHGNLAYALSYDPAATPEDLLAIHRDWDARHAQRFRAEWRPHANDRNPDRPIRIGFVSADLYRHPIGYFMEPVLAHHDRVNYPMSFYANRLLEDDLTARLRRQADGWLPVTAIGDRDLAERIRADRIDILVDMSGHTAGHRLAVIARKPAPVQVAWAGYISTTGLAAIDYMITDNHETPPGVDSYYTETLMRLPDGWLCYAPPEYAPPVGPLPMVEAGAVTFGCFNNLAKLNPPVARLWTQVLDGVPGSRLILKSSGLEKAASANLIRMFSDAGLDPARLELQGVSPHRELLGCYNLIDVALDPFPYSGGLTTLEALWMGVPVVTLGNGTRFASRHTVSHLSVVGLTELIAKDDGDYVGIAAGLAQDRDRLAGLRQGLRARMAASPVCDGARFAHNLEALFREMWRRGCAT